MSARHDLIPDDVLNEIARVLGAGAERYGARNWEREPGLWSHQLDKAIGHIERWTEREPRDATDGQNHLAHATTRLMFLLAYDLRSIGVDDVTFGSD